MKNAMYRVRELRTLFWLAPVCAIALTFATRAVGAEETDAPAGFDPATLQKVLDGQIVLDDQLDTGSEFHNVFRAYFNRVSPEAYQKLVVNYEKYPSLFPEVTAAKTTSTNGNMSTYAMTLVIKVAVFSEKVDIEGQHTLTPPKDAVSEGRIDHVITNHRDVLKSAVQTTRLIPYQTGILIEDDIHVVLNQPTALAGVIKRQLQKLFREYLTTFRKQLGGDR